MKPLLSPQFAPSDTTKQLLSPQFASTSSLSVTKPSEMKEIIFLLPMDVEESHDEGDVVSSHLPDLANIHMNSDLSLVKDGTDIKDTAPFEEDDTVEESLQTPDSDVEFCENLGQGSVGSTHAESVDLMQINESQLIEDELQDLLLTIPQKAILPIFKQVREVSIFCKSTLIFQVLFLLAFSHLRSFLCLEIFVEQILVA